MRTLPDAICNKQRYARSPGDSVATSFLRTHCWMSGRRCSPPLIDPAVASTRNQSRPDAFMTLAPRAIEAGEECTNASGEGVDSDAEGFGGTVQMV